MEKREQFCNPTRETRCALQPTRRTSTDIDEFFTRSTSPKSPNETAPNRPDSWSMIRRPEGRPLARVRIDMSTPRWQPLAGGHVHLPFAATEQAVQEAQRPNRDRLPAASNSH